MIYVYFRINYIILYYTKYIDRGYSNSQLIVILLDQSKDNEWNVEYNHYIIILYFYNIYIIRLFKIENRYRYWKSSNNYNVIGKQIYSKLNLYNTTSSTT